MPLINTAGTPVDANDGVLVKNPERIGNRRWGTKMFLSGQEQLLYTGEPFIQWYAHESITVSSTALALTENLAENADVALITLEDSQTRYRLDGQVPTSSTGHLASAGSSIELRGFWEVDQFRIIRVSTDAVAKVSYGQLRYA